MNKKAEELLAKSSGISLLDHSKRVSEIATYIGKISLGTNFELHQDKIKIIESTALLHDIGKSTKVFQDLLKSEKSKDKNIFRHNEIGWAVLSKYLDPTTDGYKKILNGVYWHHGISNDYQKHTNDEILNTISSDDIENIKSIILELGFNISFNDVTEKTPYYYYVDDRENYENVFIRMCVVSADRIASKYESGEISDIEVYINKSITKTADFFFVNDTVFGSGNFDSERFDKQQKIAKEVGESKTTLIKAPAGFGKTLLGLMWSSASKRKLIWVCPRNTVAQSVYISIVNELRNSDQNVSVELYLTGEVKRRNSELEGEFNSDIIVTNIDNFLKPSISNEKSDERLFFINSCDVVFDEFHELIGENGLFSGFLNIVNLRHRLTNKRTLLLSATPNNIHKLIKTDVNDSIKVLPNKDEHYPSVHNKKYKIKFKDGLVENSENTLYVHNTIRNAQEQYTPNDSLLIHSEFLDNDLNDKFNNVLKSYGKNSERNIDKSNLIGTHIIQASLDISLQNINDVLLSPDSSLQRIGRCDRWGDFNDQSTITFVNDNSMSNKTLINTLYNSELNKLWVETVKKLDGKELSLDELYVIYNHFNNENEVQFMKYLNKKKDESRDKLTTIYPVYWNKTVESKTKENVVIDVNSNKLRLVSNGIFFIVKDRNSNNWVGPFNSNIYRSIGEDFNEGRYGGNIVKEIKDIMYHLKDDKRFEYDKILKIPKNKQNIDVYRRHGVKSNTPYIRLDVEYDQELGLVDVYDIKE